MIIPEECPLCHSDDKDRIHVETDKVFGDRPPHDRKFYHCSVCDVFFLWPRFSHDEERLFYRNEFEKFMEKRNSLGGMDWSGPKRHILTNYEQRRRREEYLRPYYLELSRKTEARVLEVGCSSGFMLTGIEEMYGISCTGIEHPGCSRSI